MTKVKPSSEILRILNHYIILNLREIEKITKEALHSDKTLNTDISQELLYINTDELNFLVENIKLAGEYAMKEYRKINKLDESIDIDDITKNL